MRSQSEKVTQCVILTYGLLEKAKLETEKRLLGVVGRRDGYTEHRGLLRQ